MKNPPAQKKKQKKKLNKSKIPKNKDDKKRNSQKLEVKDERQVILQRNLEEKYVWLYNGQKLQKQINDVPSFFPKNNRYDMINQHSQTGLLRKPYTGYIQQHQKNLLQDLQLQNKKDDSAFDLIQNKKYQYQQKSDKIQLNLEEDQPQKIIKCYNPEPTQKYFLPSPLNHIKFPYRPYDFQAQSMQKLIDAMKNDTQTVLFESPTGTGKTQTILTAIFSQVHEKIHDIFQKKPKILYFTRTVTQMNQIISECQKSQYESQSMVYTTQPRLCIHPKAQQLPKANKNQFCKNLVKKDKCQFNTPEKIQTLNGKMKNDKYNIDIEDLLQIGKEEKTCPYFFSRKYANQCQTLVLSYQYIINPTFRQSIEEYLADSIMVFDEAHNLDKVLQEAYSWNIDFEQLAEHNSQVRYMIERIEDKLIFEDQIISQSEEASFACYQMIIENIEQERNKIMDSQNLKNIFDGQSVVQLLQLQNFLFFDLSNIQQFLKKINQDELLDFANKLQTYVTLYIQSPKNFDHMRMLIDSQKNISIICCSPQVGFHDILQVQPKKIILSSGTLSPFDYFEKVFNHNFQNIIQAKIPQEILQNTIKVIQMSSLYHYNNNQNIIFNYQNRSKLDTFKGLYRMLIDLNYPQQGGVLVFVPSYAVLEQFRQFEKNFKNNKINFYFEQKSGDTDKQFNIYAQSCKVRKCIFFMVFNGKFSEGVDFKNELARLVVILGIPYANFKDNSIVVKKQYLGEKQQKDMSFQTWYQRDTFIKINQAIGRIKRNLKDFGAVILLDKRYKEKQYKNEISESIKDLITTYDNFDIMDAELRKFYCYNLQIQKNFDEENQINESMKKANIIECVICYNSQHRSEFQIANCQHTICKTCWQRVLKEKLECPMCKRKVCPQHLKSINQQILKFQQKNKLIIKKCNLFKKFIQNLIVQL